MIDPVTGLVLVAAFFAGQKRGEALSSRAPATAPPAPGLPPSPTPSGPSVADPPLFSPNHLAVMTETTAEGVRRFRPEVARGLQARLETLGALPLTPPSEPIAVWRLGPITPLVPTRKAATVASDARKAGRLVFVSCSAVLPLGSCEQLVVTAAPIDAPPLLASPHLALLVPAVSDPVKTPAVAVTVETVEAPKPEVLPAPAAKIANGASVVEAAAVLHDETTLPASS